jgi:4-hydroxybenzoate polyprenyltransferase
VGKAPASIRKKLADLDRNIFRGYLQLCRPANLPTAASDIVAGAAISGGISSLFAGPEMQLHLIAGILALLAASVFLYAGGVVLNDVFDLETDRKERPERPIPSGLIPRTSAAVFGTALLVSGVLLAFLSRQESGVIALFLAAGIVLYDGLAKKSSFFGPLVMGICRGLNLWLGMSLVPFSDAPGYAWVPVIYIFAITAVSRSEVSGGGKVSILWAFFLYALAIFSVGAITWIHGGHFWQMLPFLGFFAALVYTPLLRAYREKTPGAIRNAVKAGVLGLIVMDAAWVAGFAQGYIALLVLLFWPLSGLMAKKFAVT